MSIKNRHRLMLALYGLAAIGVMVAIFSFSQQPGDESTKLSKTVLDGIKENGLDVFTPPIALGDNKGEGFHFRLEGRKWAHFYLFALLGVVEYLWWSRLILSRGDRLLGRKVRRGPTAAALAFGFCVLYACSDEFHQLFVDSRDGRPGDVLYDSLGVGMGILAVLGVTGLVKLVAKKFRRLG